MCLFFQYPPMTILYDPTIRKDSTTNGVASPQFASEQELCLRYFDKWSEQHQIDFVEHLLSRMCHYQHGHIDTYLKPMLQRDFISLLPSNYYNILNLCTLWLTKMFVSYRKRFRSCGRKYFILSRCRFFIRCGVGV